MTGDAGAGAPSEGATPRAQPFFCPYCGEQDIRPSEDAGAWKCDLCLRTWSLKLISLQ